MSPLLDESLRWSWSAWAMYAAPSILLWVAAFRRKALAPGHIGVVPFAAAYCLYCGLHYLHCTRLLAAQVDPTNDAWFQFPPIGIAFRGPFVCAAALLTGAAAREIVQHLHRGSGIAMVAESTDHHSPRPGPATTPTWPEHPSTKDCF